MDARQTLTRTLAELGWEADSGCTITEVPRGVRKTPGLVFEVELKDSRGCWRKRFLEDACTPDNIGFKVGFLEAMLRLRGQMDGVKKIMIDNSLGREGWNQHFED